MDGCSIRTVTEHARSNEIEIIWHTKLGLIVNSSQMKDSHRLPGTSTQPSSW